MKIANLNDFMKIAEEKGLNQNGNITIDDYNFLNKEVKTLQEKGIAYTIFTIIHENGKYLIVQGLRRINRIGHMVIKENIDIPNEGFVY
ncbi:MULTISPECIES: hypothetical protein [unclassified Clostridium]|uniref:hypothetical protein n=1 Tax=unclassified Clostridium TaxID=2614128 RepID=UPI0025B970D0|nr:MULTISPECIES: hypothetical protein [unclassified Clostridium]